MLDMSRRNGRDHSTPGGGRNNPLPTNRDSKGIMFSLHTEETVLVRISVGKLFCPSCFCSEDLNTFARIIEGSAVHGEVLSYFTPSGKW